MIRLDPLHAVLLSFIGLMAVLYWKRGLRILAVLRQVKSLEADLERTRSEPVKWEYRLERYELLWYPVVTAAPDSKKIISIAPGIPHCMKCIVPLATHGALAEWECSQCGAKHPESIVDAVVTDGIVNQALGYFKERHQGYDLAEKKSA